MRRFFLIIGIILVPLIPTVLLLTGVIGKKNVSVSKVTLSIWETTDTAGTYSQAIKDFKINHPYATITVTQLRPEDYNNRLIQAWAQGKGPDIFFVPSTWIGSMGAYASPMPTDVSIPVVTTQPGLFGPQTQVTKPASRAPSVAQLKDTYVDGILSDIVRNNKIWGLPLAMDTIVTYYNKDLLNNARVFTAAKTWTDLTTQIVQNNLTIQDESNAIVQSGTALGTATNLPYATDLLALIMMQNGSTMTNDAAKKVTFGNETGLEALNFFLSFSSPKKSTYSWNTNLPSALDSFLKGKVAYYFGTYADRKTIARSGLNWSVGPMLHLDARGDRDPSSSTPRFVNFARYNVGMVSKAATTAKKGTTAWAFLRYLASTSVDTAYTKSTDQLSPLKSVLATQKDDTAKSVFAAQLLTARAWYRGADAVKTESYLSQMITSIVQGGESAQSALNLAAQQVETTL